MLFARKTQYFARKINISFIFKEANLQRMDYQQYRKAQRLVHLCCNYDCGKGAGYAR